MGVRDRSLLSGLTPSGLVIAGVGFFLTRFTVTFVATDDLAGFLLVGMVPLVLGLSVAVLGVALAVGEFHPQYVRTVAVWTLVGTVAIGGLVAVTVYGRTPEAGMTLAAIRQEPYLSNVLIGGCVGGTLTGIYAARNERQRLVQRAQAKRLAVLNHLFRDATLNAITAIRGRLEVVREAEDEDAAAAITDIDDRAAALAADVEEMRHLTHRPDGAAGRLEPIDVVACVESRVADVRERHPDATVTVGETPERRHVWATARLEDAVGMVLDNAVERHPEGAPTVEVDLAVVGNRFRIAITDDAPAPSEAARRGRDAASDGTLVDPTAAAFDLEVAELLVESYRGELTTRATAEGTTATATLATADPRAESSADAIAAATAQGVTTERLALVAAASVFAGLMMGLATEALAGTVPVIGALYGVADPVVGWVTHQFHSLVFGLIYAGALAAAPARFDGGHVRRIAVAVAWGLLLWLVAAGVVMPLWLQWVGRSATVPSLEATTLITHLLWGAILGATYSLGRGYLERHGPP